MSLSRNVRRLPEVIRVPPSGMLIPGAVIASVCLVLSFVVGFGLAALVEGVFESKFIPRLLLWGPCAMGFLVGVVLGISCDSHNKRVRAFLRVHRIPPVPVLSQLQKSWSPIPRVAEVRTALQDAGMFDSSRAQIVCFGAIEIPDFVDSDFEAKIVALPNHKVAVSRTVWLVLIFLCLWIVASRFLLPVDTPFYVHLFAGGLTAGMAVGALYFAGRPRHLSLRLSPGVIQTKRCRSLNTKPVYHSYPMERGTLVIVARLSSQLTLTLSRGAVKDEIPLAQFRAAQDVSGDIWRSLLSGHPIRPTNDDW